MYVLSVPIHPCGDCLGETIPDPENPGSRKCLGCGITHITDLLTQEGRLRYEVRALEFREHWIKRWDNEPDFRMGGPREPHLEIYAEELLNRNRKLAEEYALEHLEFVSEWSAEAAELYLAWRLS